MPTVLVDGNLVRSVMVCSSQSQTSENVMHWLVSDVVGTPSLQDVATALDAVMAVDVPPMLNETSLYRGVTATKYFPVVSPKPATVFASTTTGGSASGDALPTQVAGLIRWLTDTRTVGRSFIPFPSTIFCGSDASPLVTYLNLMTTFANHLIAGPVVTGGTGSCVVSLGVQSAANGFQPVISHLSVDGWTNQNRRSLFRRGDRFAF